jgi:SAM-dependent methyltransferase
MACAICGAAMVPDRTPETFHCPGCGFFASKLPVRINAVALIDEDARERALKPVRLANFQQLLAECADLLPKGATLLEVGCAHGWFMEVATAMGMICVGIEPDRDMQQRATSVGHNVIAELFPDAMPDGARFNAITFNDVFEHLPDVNGTTLKLSDYLQPDGVVIVNLPVAEGFIFRIARAAARFGIKSPLDRMWQRGLPSPHLSYFTASTLQRLFSRAGFTLLRRGQLASVVTDGLYDRIRYDSSIGPIKAAALYAAARTVRMMSSAFASDIQYFVFRGPCS